MSNDTKRLSRLTAILTQLQTKRLLTAPELAKRFNVSVRTIYRDIKALEQANIPIIMEEGKGYSLMDGYRMPPIMFTESEANALITAEQLVLKNKDSSFVQEYTAAISKIKAVLQTTTKQKANLLAGRTIFRNNVEQQQTSNLLSLLQLALTNYTLVQINYHAAEKDEVTLRTVEPFALYHTQENWLLIAFCRLRNEYRAFRLDRINKLDILDQQFESHPLSLEEYFEICKEKSLATAPLT